MAALKYSRQREAIKHFLAGRTDHPTADTVYLNLREEFPNISLGTVYRNLALLADLGEIAKISTGGGADHYDGNVLRHQHFICTHCQQVYDIPMESIDSIIDAAAPNCPGHIETYCANFFGICNKCLNNCEAFGKV